MNKAEEFKQSQADKINASKKVAIDGSEATVRVAYKTTEVCAIFPITPSSAMAELADAWSAAKKANIWGNVPTVVELQSEGGAAGTVHGALQTGALSTTFTSSQGLLLMIPNMYKIAGELTSTVFHVAARSLAAQALSIFGDHQDVMAVRATGFAQLASNSVQETQDMALVAQAATLRARVPFVHFFDGFRTSHEINKILLLEDEQIRAMIDDECIWAHRSRALNPDHPMMRGTAQNPDTYFQSRETVNPFYAAVPGIVQKEMDKLAEITGRAYKLFDYYGAADAERVIILMGSGVQTAKAMARILIEEQQQKIGVLAVRLFRPFSTEHFLAALPSSVQNIAVLDRTKEPGASGEPLYLDVVTQISQAFAVGSIDCMPKIIGGRYGLSSKEFTPAMVARIFEELGVDKPKDGFTIGIIDDVTHTSLDYDRELDIEPESVKRCLFFGVGGDGTVGAAKNNIMIIGAEENFQVQGFFVYDSKKAGSQTISHLRFGPDPIDSPWLIKKASFIACHNYPYMATVDMLQYLDYGGTFLLNSPHKAHDIWHRIPQKVQQQMIDKQVKFYAINAAKVAMASGMGRRVNTVMQTCFFAISGVLPRDEAIAKIKASVEDTYARKGPEVVQKNFNAIDQALENLHQIDLPEKIDALEDTQESLLVEAAPKFVKEVTMEMMQGRGDLIPVSLLPPDGTYPTGTTRFDKANLAQTLPIWEPDVCIQCGNCVMVCPHATIRAKFFHKDTLRDAPRGFKSTGVEARGFPETRYTLQVYPEDCTGCGVCVDACPVRTKTPNGPRAINMLPHYEHVKKEKVWVDYFDQIPYNDRARVDFSNVRGVQFLEPLFEFSSACAGCGETPYLRLVTQLCGDRLMVANATGCSSIFGGNLPTTPWSKNSEGRGPAWSNSLFEDNAEFGFGYRVSADKHLELAKSELMALQQELGEDLVKQLVEAPQKLESQICAQRDRLTILKAKLENMDDPRAKNLLSVADHLVRRSIWIIGGDGWAYDIGAGGLDHVLSSGVDVNILVLDTEVYSNTGGQQSKSTPMGAIAKFASGGKNVSKKDLALQAISYGNVYVARVALGANSQQTLEAFREAEAYPGTSLIIAFSPCIAHGYDLEESLKQEQLAVRSGYWPLIRYNPELKVAGHNPFILDSTRPDIAFKEYAYNETRFNRIARTNPKEGERLLQMAQQMINQKWGVYEEMATRDSSDLDMH
ncbi:MAG TPA: pyruvate:ferredoxin (flavodoxin) oxidoreductase [Gammaproteobacteria bacterium]|nr:pyruvate:ferredoxin (flavodoxin) oxidoreductase [Gammaproteobacteria bacterium]